MRRDLVIAISGVRSRVGRALAVRLRAEGHTVIPVPRHAGLLPGSDVLIHLGRGSRRLAARLPHAVVLPERVLTTAARIRSIENLGVAVTALRPREVGPEEAVDLILWAVHHLGVPLELERV